MEHLKTGELARRAGVNVETLRFYEREGLLPEPFALESPRAAPAARLARGQFVAIASNAGINLALGNRPDAARVKRNDLKIPR